MMKKILSGMLAAALLLLSVSCSAPPPKSDDPAPSASVSDQAPARELTEEQSAAVDKLASFYEQSGQQGNDYVQASAQAQADADGQTADIISTMAFQWLKENNKLEPYMDDQYSCELPAELYEPIGSFLTGLEAHVSDQQTRGFYVDNNPAPVIELERVDCSPTFADDGKLTHVTAVYRRWLDIPQGKQPLYPVTYNLEVVDTPPVPEPLAGHYTQGEPLYRVVSILNHRSDAEMIATLGEHLWEPKEYTLSTPEDLIQMAERVNGGDLSEVRAHYTLTNDIDLGGVEFTPIGRNGPLLWTDHREPRFSGFQGSLDGGGHTIRGLVVRNPAPTGYYGYEGYAGLFAVLGPGGSVGDLTIADAQIISEARINDKGEAVSTACGILAGRLAGGTVNNCHVTGSVTGGQEAGGLAGSATYASGSNDLKPDGEPRYQSVITDCTANVTVAGQGAVGGLIGLNHYTATTNCSSQGTVTATAGIDGEMPGSIGGFAGHNIAATLTDCTSNAEVFTLVPAQIVGAFVGLNEGTIQGCSYSLALASAWKPAGDSPRPDLLCDITGT